MVQESQLRMCSRHIQMASLTRFDPLQDVDVVVRFGFVWAQSRHSQRRDSSRRAQVGQTCKVPAGQESKMAQERQ